MRFASLESVRQSAVAAIRRFPVPLICAWGAGGIIDALIVAEGTHHRAFAAALALTLGIPVCFAIALLGERAAPDRSAVARLLPQVGALVVLAALAWVWPHWSGEVQWRRYAQLSLLAHALVAFLPYLVVREPNGFWQYNRTMLERFVLASVFSVVLLAGLEGALASLRPLFGIQVSGKAFALVSTRVWFVFHPWFFFAGVPRDLGSLEARRDYPAVVRVFAQFILVPLVAIYQALLSAYLFKVVVTGKWPSGLIGWLVSAEAVAGILAILLVHPVRERVENLWVRTFARGFYLALVPSIAMLAVSIAKRVSQYGVTEDRYFVIALTAWLGAISLYFIVRRDGDIRWIPITLAALALVTFGGPWSAYDVSLASQRTRLVRLLEAHGMWKDGSVARPARGLTFEARRELSSVLVYLLGRHGGAAVRPELGAVLAAADSAFTDPERQSGAIRAQQVATRLGFTLVNPWDAATDSGGAFSWTQPWSEVREATPVDGFEYHARVDGIQMAFRAGSRSLVFWCDPSGRRMILADDLGHRSGIPPTTPVDTLATAPLAPLIAATREPRPADAPLPRVSLMGPGARGTLQVTVLSGSERPEFRVYGLTGDLFFSLVDSARDSSGAAPP